MVPQPRCLRTECIALHCCGLALLQHRLRIAERQQIEKAKQPAWPGLGLACRVQMVPKSKLDLLNSSRTEQRCEDQATLRLSHQLCCESDLTHVSHSRVLVPPLLSFARLAVSPNPAQSCQHRGVIHLIAAFVLRLRVVICFELSADIDNAHNSQLQGAWRRAPRSGAQRAQGDDSSHEACNIQQGAPSCLPWLHCCRGSTGRFHRKPCRLVCHDFAAGLRQSRSKQDICRNEPESLTVRRDMRGRSSNRARCSSRGCHSSIQRESVSAATLRSAARRTSDRHC